MKRALITGGGKRIGGAIVRALSADGWYVCIHCNRSREDADILLDQLQQSGGNGVVVQADLTKPDEIANLVPRCVKATGPLSLLINNASLFRYDRFDTMTMEAWDAHQSVNLKAPAFLSQAFASQLEPDKEGHVITLIDAKLSSLNPDYFSYTVPKLALKTLTEMMAISLPANIRANGIAPGLTLPSEKMTSVKFEHLHRLNPLGRGVSESDIVAAVKFLIENPAMHGQVITLDAGHSIMGQPRDVAFLSET